MYDITQPHYSGFLGFQEQLCSHYVVIVLNTVAHSEFRIRLSGSGPDAESASLGLRMRERVQCVQALCVDRNWSTISFRPLGGRGRYGNSALLSLISIFISFFSAECFSGNPSLTSSCTPTPLPSRLL